MSIDLRRDPSHREVSGARPKVERNGGPADLLKTRVGRLVCLGVAVFLIALGASVMLIDGETAATGSRDEGVAVQDTDHAPPAATDLASYAFLLPELEGLPPNTRPGTEIEIWATWQPPVTKKLKVHQLVPRATVAKIIPSIEPGPPTVMLELERRFIPDLMYGDRFGALSIVLASEVD
ncbi:MAG TPA: hypothetical protein VFD47_12330 [Actinomycetota bacterium]|nr:hypothetical protein [Actinomycetota bacterium]